MSEQGGGKSRGVGEEPPAPPHHYYYGTFQGVANYPPPLPPTGFPQPAPPPGYTDCHPPHYYGYQTVPGYVVPVIRPYREERLPCCGVGLGWFLFITGFFFGAVPWYIGAFLLLCVRLDHREKAGLIACTVAALLASIAVTFSVTTDTYLW